MTTVCLKGGIIVALDAVVLAISLEDRGHVLRAVGQSLYVANRNQLSSEQIDAIKRHRTDLLAIARYEVPVQ